MMTVYQVLLAAFVLAFSAVELLVIMKLGRWYEGFYRKRKGMREGERIGPFLAVVAPAVAIVFLNSGTLVYLVFRYL